MMGWDGMGKEGGGRERRVKRDRESLRRKVRKEEEMERERKGGKRGDSVAGKGVMGWGGEGDELAWEKGMEGGGEKKWDLARDLNFLIRPPGCSQGFLLRLP